MRRYFSRFAVVVCGGTHGGKALLTVAAQTRCVVWLRVALLSTAGLFSVCGLAGNHGESPDFRVVLSGRETDLAFSGDVHSGTAIRRAIAVRLLVWRS